MVQSTTSLFENNPNQVPRMPLKSKKETFEEDQVKVFAKIVTILSQDPNNPMEPQKIFEFHNSMMQMIQSKKQTIALEDLSKSMQFSQFLQAGALAGEDVEVKGNQFSVGTTQLKYNVPENALKTFIYVLDKDGVVVKTSMADAKPGEAIFSFDHKGNDGKVLPPGDYTYRVRSFLPSADPLAPLEEQLSEALMVPEKGALPKLSYYMPKGIAKANIEVAHETGRVVQVLPGDITEGKHDFTVDGFKDGAAFEPGIYEFKIRAFTDKDEEVDVETRVSTVVEGVEMKNGFPVLRQSGPVYAPLENYTALNKIFQKNRQEKGE